MGATSKKMDKLRLKKLFNDIEEKRKKRSLQKVYSFDLNIAIEILDSLARQSDYNAHFVRDYKQKLICFSARDTYIDCIRLLKDILHYSRYYDIYILKKGYKNDCI